MKTLSRKSEGLEDGVTDVPLKNHESDNTSFKVEQTDLC